MKQLKKLNRKGAKAAKPFSNRNGRFEKTAIIFSVRSFKTDSIPITVPFSEMPAGPIALPNRPSRFGKKQNLSLPRSIHVSDSVAYLTGAFFVYPVKLTKSRAERISLGRLERSGR